MRLYTERRSDSRALRPPWSCDNNKDENYRSWSACNWQELGGVIARNELSTCWVYMKQAWGIDSGARKDLQRAWGRCEDLAQEVYSPVRDIILAWMSGIWPYNSKHEFLDMVEWMVSFRQK